ncbi:thylakoid-associated protein [Synechocystis sp. FACHB-383]|uniref:thylakoid-associated protein n=1 Tax=Synechocystis sp. FACHB-383 TaxID=2692864 RepID=UPI001682EED1|nr:thylakoid-associated protein [Synechocystis sp. FACHB-383]MBD2655242.1 thylakoid-associated protein [Synechocystis sp. FACHB-383]
MTTNNSTLLDTIQQGFRITVGATATLVETLQDPQKRQGTFQDLQQEWDQRASQWAQKGTTTETEARQYVDQLLDQWRRSMPGPLAKTTDTASNKIIDFATAKKELDRLTEEIATLKGELAQDRPGQGG